MDSVAGNIAAIRARIVAAALAAGRDPAEITLVAVTKKVPPERVTESVQAGITDIGENYVQEAQAKAALLPEDFPAAWHLIGHLQSNKAKAAVERFDLIQSVDSFPLAREIDKQAARLGKRQRVLIEVNIAELPQRTGVLPEGTLELAARLGDLPSIALCGLMGIAPSAGENTDTGAVRAAFERLRIFFDRLPPEHQQVLSMGMSNDFEMAIAAGATLIRVGTAIFGSRQ